MVHHINFKKLSENYSFFNAYGNVYFPLKTNSNDTVVYSLYELGASMDCRNGFLVSTLCQALKASKYSKHMSITMINTLESAEQYVEYYNIGVRKFVVADHNKLNRLLEVIPGRDLQDLEVILKLSLSEITGITLNTETSMVEEQLILDTVRRHGINCGISVYIPNDFQNNYATLKATLNMIRLYGAEHSVCSISIGGLSKLGEMTEIEELQGNNSDAILETIRNFGVEQRSLGVDFRLEPGKIMMEGVVDTDCAVIAQVKTQYGYAITIEGSTYNEFWDAIALGRKFIVEAVNGVKLKQTEKSRVKVRVYGDSGDFCDSITAFSIPTGFKIAVGDTITILGTGYYFGRQ